MVRQGGKPQLSVSNWDRLVPDSEWAVYSIVLRAAQERRLPFALGGGFAFSTYAQRWRDTKDIDLYILQKDRDRFIQILNEYGFEDYHPREPYDRKWIYRGTRSGLIVDLIWAMANQR